MSLNYNVDFNFLLRPDLDIYLLKYYQEISLSEPGKNKRYEHTKLQPCNL